MLLLYIYSHLQATRTNPNVLPTQHGHSAAQPGTRHSAALFTRYV